MIYFDHAATTPIEKEVRLAMEVYDSKAFGNPSSIHQAGREAKFHLEDARRTIARSIHAKESDIYFTSGGTEANNLAIIGSALARQTEGKHIITSKMEHHAVLHVMEYLESIGFTITYVPVDEAGLVQAKDIEEALREDTILVSIMMVNNETGVSQPIEAIGELLKDTSVIFHTDAVQAFKMMEIDVANVKVDVMSVSSHKINGPKGIGFLYKKSDITLQPLLFGGNQESMLRPGTENVSSVIGFAKAVERLTSRRSERMDTIRTLYFALLEGLRAEKVPFHVNGDEANNLGYIVNLTFPWVKNDILLANLDLENIAISSGSACTAGAIEASHVLVAMYGVEDERIHHAVRISFGHNNSVDEIEVFIKVLKKLYDKLA